MRPWILRPHNYSQVIPRNYYNVAYRNTGVYKGMGQTCDVLTDPTCGITSLQQTELQQTIPDAILPASAVRPTGTPGTVPIPGTVPTWVWAAAAVFLVLMVAKR